MMKTRLFVAPLIALCAVALIAADGERKEKRGKKGRSGVAHVTPEQLILVKEFSTENTKVFGDHSKNPDRVAAKKLRVPPELARRIILELNDRGYKAKAYEEDLAVDGAVVLDGDILAMNNGAAAARIMVGFAAGQAWMKAKVRLYAAVDPSKVIAETQIRGTSKGSAGIFSAGNKEPMINAFFAKNTAKFLTGKKR